MYKQVSEQIIVVVNGGRMVKKTWADPEGGGRGSGPPPPKNHKKIGFLSNIDPDPLKITKLPSQHSIVGHYRHASKTPF